MKIIKTILIANRGEIASRIIRTCRKMGIRTIAVFSEADRDALFVEQADQAVFLGNSPPAESYLNADKILAAAKKTGADALHPGYGFLSENAEFAQRCAEENVIFIGPHPAAIRAMGSKSNAKALMQEHRVPTVPGYQGADQRLKTLTEAALKIGFPLLLKATAGGGGKGMRIVRQAAELETAIVAAKRESKNAFGEEELLIEKYISSGRHIEFQIFGDQHGNAIHLLERECSIQRRYQKVIEESPSPVLSDALRQKMGDAAVKAAKALNYDNAGTVEFIFDEKTEQFYFLEVNTRLQVEHPVTEAITGLDLVQLQIEVAQGLPLSMQQEEVRGKGYAIECRLYAEDALNNFLPVTGTIERFETPVVEGLRVETAVQSGSKISVFYDPMIAKLIVWDNNRPSALRKMQYVLRHLVCLGTTTNQELLRQILETKNFQQGKYDTHFIQNHLDLNQLSQQEDDLAAIASSLLAWQNRTDQQKLLRAVPSGWRNSFYDFQKVIFLKNGNPTEVKYRFLNPHFQFLIKEKTYHVRLISTNQHQVRAEIDGTQYTFNVAQKGADFFVQNERTGTVHLQQQARFPIKKAEKVVGNYEAPMPSQIIKIEVATGQKVAVGDPLLVLSSMKMENVIRADVAGTVAEVYVVENSHVEAGALLLKIDA